jgi:hypothetical protein
MMSTLKLASVFKRPGYWYFDSASKTKEGIWIATGPTLKVEDSSPHSVKGEAALKALGASELSIPRPIFWRRAEERWVKAFGVKSWRELIKNTYSCDFVLTDSGQMYVEPNRKTEGNFVPITGKRIIVRADAPPEEIGAALEEAFKLCQ